MLIRFILFFLYLYLLFLYIFVPSISLACMKAIFQWNHHVALSHMSHVPCSLSFFFILSYTDLCLSPLSLTYPLSLPHDPFQPQGKPTLCPLYAIREWGAGAGEILDGTTGCMQRNNKHLLEKDHGEEVVDWDEILKGVDMENI